MIEELSAATTAPCPAQPPVADAISLVEASPRTPKPRARVVRTIAALRIELKAARESGLTIGLVPTMGALHEGHLSLIRAARRHCDLVVVSVFVNPTQFDEQADLLAYPRDEPADASLAARAGADLLFMPAPMEIYRPGFATTVEVHGLTDRLEGAVRGAAHFHGVTTVVCKLLNIVSPHIAYFGQKDAQQAAVIGRMVADLDIDVEIETLPIVREPDGLAMSSRNARLSENERAQAVALHAALSAASGLCMNGERSAARLIEAASQTLSSFSVRPEYVAIVDPHTFEEVACLQRDGLLLIAARIGETRLIDNQVLRVTVASPDAFPTDHETVRRSQARACSPPPDLAVGTRGPSPGDIQRHQGDVIATCSA